jgi:hypothetical protein
VPLDADESRPVSHSLPETMSLEKFGQLHVVVGAHADGAVGSAPLVGIFSDEIEGPDTHVLLCLGVTHPPGPLGHLEDEGEGCDKAPEQNAPAYDLGWQGQVIQSATGRVAYCFLRAVGREDHICVGEQEPFSCGPGGPGVQGVGLSQPAFWQ